MIFSTLIGCVRSEDFSGKGFRPKAPTAFPVGVPSIYGLSFKGLKYYGLFNFGKGVYNLNVCQA